MNSEYILKINTDKDKLNKITSILGISPTSTENNWELSIFENSELYYNAIHYFLDLIELHLGDLNDIGITMEDVSIWYLYEYDEQCNMEFQPKELKKLGDLGITLCVSCWKSS